MTADDMTRDPAECPELVVAARDGEQGALEELVVRCLPLVYNIVGRALPKSVDMDDVVQDTMLCVVRGLPGLRDEHAFRSWLVAVTINQIRRHRQARRLPTRDLEELVAVADPGADFVDLILTELGLSGQRRETVEATRWMDEDYRELLSLWWLVTTGHLTRKELVNRIGLADHHVTVRVSRMKAQLDTARQIVRALTVVPRCARLSQAIHLWNGRPSPLWRKRLARHLRGCGYCGGLGTDLVPAERLLVNVALLPLPVGYATQVLAHAAGHTTAVASGTPAAAVRSASHPRVGSPVHRAGRLLASFTRKASPGRRWWASWHGRSRTATIRVVSRLRTTASASGSQRCDEVVRSAGGRRVRLGADLTEGQGGKG
ncbi:RNA polymerase sigma factor [Streptomyces sp. NPDC059010]|uniref:RNA polymerase sigma factor n=1 Tax=Streptomyces sp. NPDC059010 TaxID=3346695 RepID=UPI0036CC9CF8